MARIKNDGKQAALGFVARSRTGMVRHRDGIPFFPERHSYPGAPTPAQLADLCIEIGEFDATVPAVSEAIAQRQAALDEAREAERKLLARYMAGGAAKPEDAEV